MTLEELIKTFTDHEKQAHKSDQERIKQFKEDYPEEPLPDHFKERFMLPMALAFMCSEILKLKNKLP